MATELQTRPSSRRDLEWESSHFGSRAAQLCDANLDDDALSGALGRARGDGIQLLVWPASGGRVVSPVLLNEYQGLLVDRKATFSKSLEAADVAGNLTGESEHLIVPYHAATASPALYDLALAAGVFSRFGVDPHIKRERFEAMYRLWIDRSVRGELADAVLVARIDDHPAATGRLGGMITLSRADGVASIGLVAVAAEMRGRGLGTALMRAAERWMLAHHAREARVVTQLANVPACRLYERAGFRLLLLQHYYHFWLQVDSSQHLSIASIAS